MKSTTRIPVWRTLVNWIAVVILGSIVAPVLLNLLNIERADAEIIPLFMVVSAVFSLPALAVFLLANWRLNRRRLPTGDYRVLQGMVHLGASLLTFLVIWALSDGGSDVIDSLLVIGATYTTLGQLAWWLTFFSHRNGQDVKKPADDLLDDLG